MTPQSRDDFPHMLNELGLLGTAVEVGTNRGHHAESFRRAWRGLMLYCVDPWELGNYALETYEERVAARRECYDRLSACLRESVGSTAMLPAKSIDGAREIEDAIGQGRLDFVYIDGDHSYEGVQADLLAWWPLVKKGGIIAGHDWIPDGWRYYGDEPATVRAQTKGGLVRDGWPCFVQSAVRDFFSDAPVPFSGINTTSPETDGGWRSWWVRK